MKQTKVKKPSHNQATWLRRIALSPMIKIYVEGEKHPRFSLLNGEIVPSATAKVLIANRWVRGQNDGLLAGENQTYTALTP